MKTFTEKHKLLNRPFAEMTVWFIIGNINSMLIWAVIAGLITEIMKDIGIISEGSTAEDTVMNILFILGGIILLHFFKKRYSPCFKGFGWLENCKQKDIIISLAIFMGVDIVLGIIDIIRQGGAGTPSIAILIGALQPGITEEITDRMLPLAAAMYIFKDRKSVIPLIVFTSVLFGLSHAFNLSAGADLGPTIVQIFSAGAAGVFMAAVYIRTGSFLPGMLVHFLHDFIAFWGEGMDVATGGVAIWEVAEVLIFATVQIVLTYFLLKNKNENIKTVWNKIWVNDEVKVVTE